MSEVSSSSTTTAKVALRKLSDPKIELVKNGFPAFSLQPRFRYVRIPASEDADIEIGWELNSKLGIYREAEESVGQEKA